MRRDAPQPLLPGARRIRRPYARLLVDDASKPDARRRFIHIPGREQGTSIHKLMCHLIETLNLMFILIKYKLIKF